MSTVKKAKSYKHSQDRKLLYRSLIDNVENIAERRDMGLQVAKEVGQVLKAVNELESDCSIEKRIENSDEVHLDSTLLSNSSKIVVSCIESVEVSRYIYSGADFAQKLLFNNTDADNASDYLLNICLPYARSMLTKMPKYNFIYGVQDNKLPTVRKIYKKQKKEKLIKTQPERIKSLTKDAESIEEIVKVLQNVLIKEFRRNNNQSINYFDYVIDTDSFSQTVENVFYCSFLIRDGLAKITIDNNNVPKIKPLMHEHLKKFRDEGGSNAQMITNITVAFWETFKRKGFLQIHKENTM